MICGHHPFQINQKGHLEIGGLDAVELAEKYGTPLYVYDVSVIRDNCRAFVDTFEKMGVSAQVTYASKAFSSIAMLEVVKEEGLGLDVVSQGELYTALQADFPTEKIHFHGNNKSFAELEMAVLNQIGCVVLDNFHEIDLLEALLEKHHQTMDVLIRITPGIESETHQYIQTGNEDSKFGFQLQNGQADVAFKRLHQHHRINFKGMHCHIGSQIVDLDRFLTAADVLFAKLAEWKEESGFIPPVLNLGGGFGIPYTKDDPLVSYATYIEGLVEKVKACAREIDIPLPEIWVEPGRAIAGNAGVTLYTTGSLKEIPGVRTYLPVDGGMSDNIRPALYQAEYEGIIANKADEPATSKASIAGKLCESGDMLIWNLPVPKVEAGDILAVFATGAYGYSMASNYNRFPRPAVVFVENERDVLVVQRETLQDIVKNDLPYTTPVASNVYGK